MKIKSLRMMFTLICIIAFFATVQTVAYADDNDAAISEKQKVQMNSDMGKSEKVFKKDAALQKKNDIAKKGMKTPGFKKQSWVLDKDGDYIIWWNNKDNFTLYKGEKLYFDFDMLDVYDNCSTIPYVEVVDDYYHYIDYWDPADSDMIVEEGGWDGYYGWFNIGSSTLPTGRYLIIINAMPCDSNGYWMYDEDVIDQYYDIPYAVVTFDLRPLPKPTKVKAKAGKKKVTVTFNKSAGATKYEIYRSTKKGKGYKKIKTVTKPRYVDRKVKKGKKYFYKVKAVRKTSTYGTAYSSLTAPAKSGKVKR